MKIQIRHDAASDGVKTYITDAFQSLQEKYEQVVVTADFRVDQEGPNGHRKTIECILHVPHDTITVHEASDEIHKSIDMAFKILDRQLQRHKETYVRPGAKIRHNVEREGGVIEGNVS
jgi:ribosomal subunit interface protein